MNQKSLETMNLLDDFLFGKLVSHPEYGEEFSRELLKVIVKKDLGRIRVVPQKIYYGADYGLHGTRLDVYVEEEETTAVIPADDESIYDIEVDQNHQSERVRALPWRVRFYHAKIDSTSLKTSERYDHLKNVMVILIMPYDPFGLNRMVYTIRNMCEERPDMKYEDGARTIFLYTRGSDGNPPRELRELLHYMEQTREENATNNVLQKIQRMVESVKTDKEVSFEYMKIFEREEMLLEEGREVGREEGEAFKLLQIIDSLMKDGNYDLPKVLKMTGITMEEYTKAKEVADKTYNEKEKR